MTDPLESFWKGVEFEPDPFQREAAEVISEGSSVVVTAPTGAGKTLVAEAAIYLCLARGLRAFYTTPLKALSNQKYSDFSKSHGSDRVGLLTGDNVINPGAELRVATLEVLRNMIYADPGQLDDVGLVVLDEAHYLQDRSRGAAWEEVIIHCPKHVQFVCLSATISNNHEFADWVRERRGTTRLITTTHRPVPLEPMYMIKDKGGSRTLHLQPMFIRRDGRSRPNPRLEHMLGLERGRKRRFKTPNRTDVVERLETEQMLPAIYFIFSRAGCDAAARRLVESGVRLTSQQDRERIRQIAEDRTAHLADGDLDVLGYDLWLIALEAGVASHHAGLVPAFKETVEELFGLGLVRVVFATETLSLGINMPARSVVIENLSKFNGETHELLRPGDYTQLTGRAGRRGIDVEGFGIVLHSPYVQFDTVQEIASLGSHELSSSFRPTYNMAANLIATYPRAEAEALLEASFAAFQHEGEFMDAEARIESLYHQLAEAEEDASCERGDVSEYEAELAAVNPSRRQDGIKSILRPGAVIDVVGGPRDGRYAVLKRLSSKGGGARYLVLSTSGKVSTIGYKQITDASTTTGSIDLPTPFKPRSRRFIQDTLRRMRKIPKRPAERGDRRRPNAVDHPVGSCPDAAQHLAALRRANRVRRRIEQHRNHLRESGHGLVEEFRSIHGLLGDLDYVDDWALMPRGERLRRIYNEMDLLIAETIERGILYDLHSVELAALASVFVYEPRSDQESAADWPNSKLHERWEAIDELWNELIGLERDHRLSPTRKPDPGFGVLAHQWAGGAQFEDLPAHGMAAGDFVRVSRQLADLLRQIRDGISELSEDAGAALVAIDRGVVAAQGVG